MAVILILLLFTGCSSMADRLSVPGGDLSSEYGYPANLAKVTIGVTTQQEVRKVFGSPTNLQTALRNATLRETWAYAQASPSINPIQYLPLVGGLVVPRSQEDHSFSVSFSSEGIVEGISVRGFQPYGDVLSSAHRDRTEAGIHPYGTNNPSIRASADTSSATHVRDVLL